MTCTPTCEGKRFALPVHLSLEVNIHCSGTLSAMIVLRYHMHPCSSLRDDDKVTTQDKVRDVLQGIRRRPNTLPIFSIGNEDPEFKKQRDASILTSLGHRCLVVIPMVFSPPEFRKDKLPYRVIDVDATLSSNGMFRFCQATSISDFSVISHMWNDHVTELMNQIKGAATKLRLSYPQAVEETNWADVAATREVYISITHFLEALQEQGVKKVWMDTLCIDQSKDSKETAREIPLMGAYYRHSSACYVPINGFGFNYKLPMGEQAVMKSLPWINRVWTFQEFLLPDKVYFFVDLEEWMERWLALRVATAGTALSHFCTCCMGKEFHYMMEALERMSEKMKGATCGLEVIRDAGMNHICQHCGSPPLLIKVKNKAQLYLVEREAIYAVACLAQFHKQVETLSWEETQEEQEMRINESLSSYVRNEWLLRVIHVRRQGTWCRTFEILNEVRNRQCTKERDYVLGLLGLLGVNTATNNQQEEATLQLTAETPEEQLVELASAGAFTEHLLVELCWMDTYSGRYMPNMSWIPDLTGRVSSTATPVLTTKEFHSLATNVCVAPEGPITLTVKVFKGYVTRKDPKNLAWEAKLSGKNHRLHFQHQTNKEEGVFSYSNQFSREEVERFNQEHMDIIIDADDRLFGGEDGKSELTFDESGFIRLPFKGPMRFFGFEMWLLYLGHFLADGTVLLCLHKKGGGSVVHKIGTLTVSYMGMRRLLDDLEDPPEEVTIAGYGKYLDTIVDLL